MLTKIPKRKKPKTKPKSRPKKADFWGCGSNCLSSVQELGTQVP